MSLGEKASVEAKLFLSLIVCIRFSLGLNIHEKLSDENELGEASLIQFLGGGHVLLAGDFEHGGGGVEFLLEFGVGAFELLYIPTHRLHLLLTLQTMALCREALLYSEGKRDG